MRVADTRGLLPAHRAFHPTLTGDLERVAAAKGHSLLEGAAAYEPLAEVLAGTGRAHALLRLSGQHAMKQAAGIDATCRVLPGLLG
jgi:hypothetical protein